MCIVTEHKNALNRIKELEDEMKAWKGVNKYIFARASRMLKRGLYDKEEPVDVDEKGGAAVSVSYVTKKPIIYIGIGQEYKDLAVFDDNIVMENLGLGA